MGCVFNLGQIGEKRMSRIIKFRAWHKAHKEMVYFNPEKAAKDHFQATAIMRLASGKDDSGCLMQFTGLKDRNGVDVFESDVGRHPDGSQFVVKWDQGHCGFRACYGDYTTSLLKLQFDDKDGAVIIGNVHENPELLEAAK